MRQKASQTHKQQRRRALFRTKAVIRRTANAERFVGAAAGVVDVATAAVTVAIEDRIEVPSGLQTGFPNAHPSHVSRALSSLGPPARRTPADPIRPGRLPDTSPCSCPASRFPSTNA